MVLLEELVEEVVLRLPPEDPASLVRAALVCKPWCRIISDRRFRRRFSEFHRSPPMLALLCSFIKDSDNVLRLLPYSACPLLADKMAWRAIDARHGRVLLNYRWDFHLAVWDPMAYGWHHLPQVSDVWQPECWNAAVLCASTASGACDHIDCSSGPVVVVSVGSRSKETCLCVYSSEASSWSELTYVPGTRWIDWVPTALVGNAVYFRTDFSSRTIRYDLATRETSVIPLPTRSSDWQDTMLITMEDGRLGAAMGHSAARLSLWSMEANSNGDVGWTQILVIEFGKLLTVDLSISSKFVGFADGIGVFFVEADGRLFSIELKSGQVKMLCEGTHFRYVIPYSSWCTIALEAVAASTGEEPTTGASSASED